MSTNTLQLTNAEKSAKLNAKAQKALLKGISRDWQAFEETATEVGKLTIKGVNLLRSVGEKLKQASGHEQIGFEFWERHAAELPKSMSYTKAKCAVHVANRISAPVTTVQEAMAVQHDLFKAVGEWHEPKRLTDQTPHEHNPWSDFVAGAASFTRLLGDLNPAPMQQWRRDELEKFVETTKPIVERYREAAVLLEEAR